LPTTTGVVVVVEGEVDLNLRRVATGYGLSVLAAASADQALQGLVCLRPKLVIVQVSRLVDEALKLIRLVANLAQPPPLIAVATSHGEEIEQSVWHAGATWYLPDAGSHLLEQVLTAVLPQRNSVRSDRNGADE